MLPPVAAPPTELAPPALLLPPPDPDTVVSLLPLHPTMMLTPHEASASTQKRDLPKTPLLDPVLFNRLISKSSARTCYFRHQI